jgi:hypothetical protein
MKRAVKTILRGGLLAGVLGLAGCTYGIQGPGFSVTAGPPVVAAYDEPAYAPVYYNAGWYGGPYWNWYGPDHHLFHEYREMHERRFYGHRGWR